ncbi:MAG TPA: NAD(P)H-dependent oxidoreductase [Polyangia bacterium]|jgi:NAD(P)H-dependent FMN reductase|nr:NAD(P)H-dependent oxidoreductase [Polyangia bacterium]
MLKLHVVVCSTRPGRHGPTIANWVHGFAQKHGKFEVRLVDLAEVNLPVFDEPHHPRLRQYTKEHTKRWSETVDAADAFAFVTPEYNYNTPPALVNALDYLLHEWAYKPVAFVSYGGPSGGLRSVQMTKLFVTAFKMMPMSEMVSLPFFSKHIEDGVFKADEAHEKAATAMLDETHRWADALKVLRAK